ncbi:MAG: methyltransferase domain-containing protein [Myxococcota bacterium]|nr:methyltransferase domain-containing protein [Myxococcota bacterium]
MARSQLIARQSSHPTGPLGHVVARVMAVDTRRLNQRMFEILDPQPGQKILELGSGHGRMLRRIARAVAPGGIAVGADPSEVMRRVARRHLHRELAAGTARLVEGAAASLPLPDAGFDQAASVHTLYFWPDLDAGLRELHRVLRPGGRLLMAFHDGADPAILSKLPANIYTLRPRDAVADGLRAAGFHDVSVPIDPETRRVIATAWA